MDARYTCVFLPIYYFGVRRAEFGWLSYAIYFVALLIFLFPPFLSALFICIDATNIKKLKNGSFIVTTDTVYFKEKADVGPYRDRNIGSTAHQNNVIRLSSCGAEVTVNDVWYDITSDDDVFYVVFYKDQKTKQPQKCYPAKIYEYKNNQEV